MRLSLLALLLLGITSSVNADTILFEDFEDATITYVANPLDDLSDIANRDYYGRIAPDTATPPADIMYSNPQGNGYYGAKDTDGVPGAGSTSLITLDWSDINTSSFTDLNLSWFVAEDDAADSNEDWDQTTSVRLLVSRDNGAFEQVFGIESSSDAVGNTAPRVDTNFDGLGDGVEITDTFTQFDIDLANANEVDIRLIIEDLDTSDEDIAFDSLWLQGNNAAIPEPSTFAFLMVGGVALGFRRRRRRE